ncbi:MAG: riboflavin synthase [Acidimicrobiales bacterium]
MFTGMVEEVGTFAGRDGPRLRFDARRVLDDAVVGASIAVNGCCLTVVGLGPGWWEAELSDETVARTSLGGLAPGDAVNLERPLRAGDRFGGHLVQGHVDGVGRVLAPAPELAVQAPSTRHVVAKGSISVDGVSLTVVDLSGDAFTVAVIPHTAAVTTLGHRRVGDLVNLEFDLVAKYVERLLEGR